MKMNEVGIEAADDVGNLDLGPKDPARIPIDDGEQAVDTPDLDLPVHRMVRQRHARVGGQQQNLVATADQLGNQLGAERLDAAGIR